MLGTNIAVLLDCSSRLDSVAFLPYLLTYIMQRGSWQLWMFSFNRMAAEFAPILGGPPAGQRGH